MIEKRELHTKDSGKIFIISYLFILIVQSIIGLIFRATITDSFLWTTMIANQATFLIVSICYLKSRRINPIELLGFKNKLSRKQWLFLPVLTIVLMIASSPLALLFSALLQSLGYSSSGYFPMIDTLPYMIFAVVVIAVLPAICEEILFRGTILRGLKRRGYLSSALTTALLFALIHSNPEQLVHQFFLGLVFAIMMQTTNNILAPMIMHFTNNFVAIFLDSILASLGIANIESTGLVVMILMVLLGVIFTVMAVKYMIKLERDKIGGINVIDINKDNLFSRIISQLKSIIKYLFNSGYRKDCKERYNELMYQLDKNKPEEINELEMTQLDWILHRRNEDFKLVKISIIGTSIVIFFTFVLGLFV